VGVTTTITARIGYRRPRKGHRQAHQAASRFRTCRTGRHASSRRGVGKIGTMRACYTCSMPSNLSDSLPSMSQDRLRLLSMTGRNYCADRADRLPLRQNRATDGREGTDLLDNTRPSGPTTTPNQRATTRRRFENWERYSPASGLKSRRRQANELGMEAIGRGCARGGRRGAALDLKGAR